MDYSFIKFYKSLSEAVQNENQPIVDSSLMYTGFLAVPTKKTISQITNSDTNISFVGDIQVDLVDGCGSVVLNVDNNFYHNSFQDANGIFQINWEFGYVNQDFYTKPLHIKITDTSNQNVWFSNAILVTDYNSHLFSEFVYWANSKIYNISYDLTSGFKQRIFLVNCFDHTPQNKSEQGQYTQTSGLRVQYRKIITRLRQYLFDSIDSFINDRFDVLSAHPFVVLNGQFVTISDFKVNERLGNSNLMKAEFLANPQGSFYTYENQLFPNLEVIELLVANGAIFSRDNEPTSGGQMTIEFNQIIPAGSYGNARLYLDGELIEEYALYGVDSNFISMQFSNSFIGIGLPANGNYSIVVPQITDIFGQVFSGIVYGGWNFTVADAEFDSDYDNDFLI